MAGRVGVGVHVIRYASTLGFFGSVILTILALQGDDRALGWVFGVAVFGIMMVVSWWDEFVAAGNAREQQKGADIRQQQGFPMFPAQVQAQQVPPPNPALPPGPSSPIQHSG